MWRKEKIEFFDVQWYIFSLPLNKKVSVGGVWSTRHEWQRMFTHSELRLKAYNIHTFKSRPYMNGTWVNSYRKLSVVQCRWILLLWSCHHYQIRFSWCDQLERTVYIGSMFFSTLYIKQWGYLTMKFGKITNKL